jgi:Ran GTPase-activating protein (RanGAP) involved in mRNA processing and transport
VAKREAGFGSNLVTLSACLGCHHLRAKVRGSDVVFGCDLDRTLVELLNSALPKGVLSRLRAKELEERGEGGR